MVTAYDYPSSLRRRGGRRRPRARGATPPPPPCSATPPTDTGRARGHARARAVPFAVAPEHPAGRMATFPSGPTRYLRRAGDNHRDAHV